MLNRRGQLPLSGGLGQELGITGGEGGGAEPSNRAGVSHVCRQQSIVKKLQFTDAQNLSTFD